MKSLQALALTLWAVVVASTAGANDIILLLEAKDNAAIIARVQSSAPSIQAAAPVLDAAKADKGWMWTEYTTTIQGHVPTASLSKNFEVEPNTIVRTNPSSGAHVLTLAEASDRFQVLESNQDWTTVRFEKAIPVYFLKNTSSTAIIAAAPIAKRPVKQPRQKSRRVNPDGSVSNLAPNELPPENVTWRSAPVAVTAPEKTTVIEPSIIPDVIVDVPAPGEPETIMVMPAEVQAPEIPRSPNVVVGTPTRILSGKLVREISNFGPRYPLRLKSASGQRIAYVDMSRLFINDLRPYLDKKVYIRGEVNPIVPGSRELVIMARTIRITD